MARIDLVEALAVLAAARTNEVVLTSMGNAREWMKLSEHPLDFINVPSSMGQTPSLALGMALAQPGRRIVACSGDGSLLMNLGCLVTITAQAPRNLTLLVFDNAAYEVTGAQATAAVPDGRVDGHSIDLAQMARASGFRSVYECNHLEDWQAKASAVLDAEGPVFVLLRVATIPGAVGPRSPGHAPTRARKFREALTSHSAPPASVQ